MATPIPINSGVCRGWLNYFLRRRRRDFRSSLFVARVDPAERLYGGCAEGARSLARIVGRVANVKNDSAGFSAPTVDYARLAHDPPLGRRQGIGEDWDRGGHPRELLRLRSASSCSIRMRSTSKTLRQVGSFSV